MWCDPDQNAGEQSFEVNTTNHLQYNHHHHYHHDFPHYSNNHHHCFQNSHENTPSFHSSFENEQIVTEYAGCQANCNGWPAVVPNNEHFCCSVVSTSSSPNLPTAAQKAKIYSECEHLLGKGECNQCTVRDENGQEQAIPISDLVEIVFQTAQTFKEEPGDTVVLSKKRHQNKMAAAKYRDRQKAKWQSIKDEQEYLEKKNKDLKLSVAALQREVDEMKKHLLQKS